jgi:hypothetical protein
MKMVNRLRHSYIAPLGEVRPVGLGILGQTFATWLPAAADPGGQAPG